MAAVQLAEFNLETLFIVHKYAVVGHVTSLSD